MTRIVPAPRYEVPVLKHEKNVPYIDFPIVSDAIKTEEPFYVSYDFTVCSSSGADTTVLKWNGAGWTAITGNSNPDVYFGRGYYAITTVSNQSVTITEHAE